MDHFTAEKSGNAYPGEISSTFEGRGVDVSGDFFRQMIESSRDGIWVFDASGRTIYTNDRAAELLGRSSAEMGELTIYDVLDEAGRAQLATHLEDLRSNGPNTADVECSYLRPDGSPIPLMVGESVLRDEHGRPVAYVHRLSEDTERRALMEELSRSEEQLGQAQTIARLGSWDFDAVTGDMTWSRQLYAIFGLDPDEFTPSRGGFYERVVEADRPKVNDVITRAEEVGGDFGVDCRVCRSDGAEVWVRLLGRVTLADGAPVRLGGTVQDISAVKEAELKLLDAVVLNMLMQVMASAANSAATLAEALEMTRAQLLAHDDWMRAVAFRTTLGAEGSVELDPYMVDDAIFEPNEYEWHVARMVLANDGALLFEEAIQPANPSMAFGFPVDETTSIVVVLTNTGPFERHAMLRSMVDQVIGQLGQVAARERAAQQLAEARDAAMEASALKSEFLATMSHEIRTPMNGVIGLNELLLRTDLDSHQRRLAQGVQRAGQSLLGLINDILDFSKIEAGQLELELADFEVRPVFDNVTGIVAASASDKGLPIEVTADAEVPERLVGDPTRLGQVVSNLVSNAVKFTHEGGVRIRISVDEADTDSVMLRVEVSDTGIGIGEEQMSRLFEPFRQADASTTRTFGGTGLGLAISTQLVAALGGEIGASSTPGHGSTFWFTARFGHSDPAMDRRSTTVEAPAVQSRCTSCSRILVAEDNEINQLVALGLLEALGYTADIAENGERAVAMAARQQYAAILMDVQMPTMDGYTASRTIRESEPDGVRVPIIAMTASAVIGERERCEAAGMDDFLTKPVNSERLSSVLRAYAVAAEVAHDAHAPGNAKAAESGLIEREGAVLDESRLEELTDMGDRARQLVMRAIDNFVTRIPEVLDGLRVAVDRQDDDELRTVAHGFRGSALNLGALRVAEIALDLELLGERGRVDSGGPIVVELEEALTDTVAALDEYRAVRLAG